MTIGVNLRFLSASAAALALALPAAAAADPPEAVSDAVSVCNTASQNWQGGKLAVSSVDPQGALHYADELRAMKANGVGLENAAMHSRALAVCGDVVTGPAGGGTT